MQSTSKAKSFHCQARTALWNAPFSARSGSGTGSIYISISISQTPSKSTINWGIVGGLGSVCLTNTLNVNAGTAGMPPVSPAPSSSFLLSGPILMMIINYRRESTAMQWILKQASKAAGQRENSENRNDPTSFWFWCIYSWAAMMTRKRQGVKAIQNPEMMSGLSKKLLRR